jgi:hypothetical protein
VTGNVPTDVVDPMLSIWMVVENTSTQIAPHSVDEDVLIAAYFPFGIVLTICNRAFGIWAVNQFLHVSEPAVLRM